MLKFKHFISKITLALMVAITATMMVSPITAEAAWNKDTTGWWYSNDDGSYAKDGWHCINNTWYYFNKSGYMVTGWVKDNGNWYYMNENGAMQTGWVNDHGVWYYMNGSGVMQTGWVNVNGTWYYFGDKNDGVMKVGWQQVNGKWYYMNENGAMQTGWVSIGNKQYELTASGIWTGKTWVIDQEAWDEEAWVVDTPAWDERVTIDSEYYCIRCGATLSTKLVPIVSDPSRAGQMTEVLTGEAGLHLETCNSRYALREIDGWLHHDEVGHYETIHHEAVGHYE